MVMFSLRDHQARQSRMADRPPRPDVHHQQPGEFYFRSPYVSHERRSRRVLKVDS